MKTNIIGAILGCIAFIIFLYKSDKPNTNLELVPKDFYESSFQNITPENRWSLLEYNDAGNFFHLHPGEEKGAILNITPKKDKKLFVKINLLNLPELPEKRDRTQTVFLTIVQGNDTLVNHEIFEGGKNNLFEIESKQGKTFQLIVDKGLNSYYDHTKIEILTKSIDYDFYYKSILRFILFVSTGIFVSLLFKKTFSIKEKSLD